MVNNHQGDLLFLCFDVDCEAGLEFHGEVVGEDGNLLDELIDQVPHHIIFDFIKMNHLGIIFIVTDGTICLIVE